MTEVSKIRLLGGIGSILIILLFVPAVGFVLSLAGFVLVALSVYYLAQEMRAKAVFDNYLISIIILIGGVALSVLYLMFALLSPGVSSAISTITNATNTNSSTVASSIPFSVIENVLVPLFIFFIGLVISFVISAIFLRRSFRLIAEKSGIKLFNTAAFLFLIGAALMILFGLGAIVIFVAMILQAIAFFSLPENLRKRKVRRRK